MTLIGSVSQARAWPEARRIDNMTVTKDFPWRDGVECVIKNAINFLEPVGSGPTVSQLAARLRSIAAEKLKSYLGYLLRRENIVALRTLAEPGYSIGLVPEEYLAVGQLQRRALAKAEEIEAEANERLDQVYINAFLCDAVTLTRAAKLDYSLPTHGAEARADKFPAYQFTRALNRPCPSRCRSTRAFRRGCVWKTEVLDAPNPMRQSSCSQTQPKVDISPETLESCAIHPHYRLRT